MSCDGAWTGLGERALLRSAVMEGQGKSSSQEAVEIRIVRFLRCSDQTIFLKGWKINMKYKLLSQRVSLWEKV